MWFKRIYYEYQGPIQIVLILTVILALLLALIVHSVTGGPDGPAQNLPGTIVSSAISPRWYDRRPYLVVTIELSDGRTIFANASAKYDASPGRQVSVRVQPMKSGRELYILEPLAQQ